MIRLLTSSRTGSVTCGFLPKDYLLATNSMADKRAIYGIVIRLSVWGAVTDRAGLFQRDDDRDPALIA
ncbi:hypothetical protein GCM10010399_45750 [Dactylosporangium fulvum]